MSDTPNAIPQAAAAAPAAGAGPTTPPPQPSPQPQPTPQSATPPPAAQPQTRRLNDDDVIQIPGPDGQMMTATARQLREVASRSLSPEQMQEFQDFVANRDSFNLFKGIQSGDKDAILSMFNISDAPNQQISAEDRVAQLQNEVESLKSTLQQITPTYEQIDTLREQATLRSMISGNPDKVPYLFDAMSKNPAVLNKVMANFGLMRDMIRQAGHDLKGLPPQKQDEIRARVLYATEQDLATLASTWGVAQPKQQPTGPSGQPVLDDQIGKQDAKGTRRIQWVNGRLVDEQGRPMVQTADGSLVPAAIDTHIPGTSTGGMAVGTQTPGQKRRLSVEEHRALMRAQVSASAGNQQ